MHGGLRRIGLLLGCLYIGGGEAFALDGAAYEEPAGMSFALFGEPGGDVYGGGFETGIWLRHTPILGEWFGHWFSNEVQQGNYYALGLTLRLMPRTAIAPFIGAGAAYNGLSGEHGNASLEVEPDDRYWTGHAEAGLRWGWGVGQAYFVEGTYRYHWADTTWPNDYGWISLEYGQRF